MKFDFYKLGFHSYSAVNLYSWDGVGLKYISECSDPEEPSEAVNTTSAHLCLLETLLCCQPSLLLEPFTVSFLPVHHSSESQNLLTGQHRTIAILVVICALGGGPSLCSFCTVAGTSNSALDETSPVLYLQCQQIKHLHKEAFWGAPWHCRPLILKVRAD